MPTKKPIERPALMVCAQQIETRWTKASRGGAGAVTRNKVPRVLPFSVPTQTPQMPSLLLQVIGLSEGYPVNAAKGFQNRYEPGLKVLPAAEPYHYRGVSACLSGGLLSVEYEYKWEQGMPWRYQTTNEVAHLEPGQWCQVLLNGRYSSYRYAYGESNHWYESTFINVGLFDRVESGMFLKTEPVKVYDRMAILF